MSEWKKIAKTEAEAHQLYGVQGWLLFYALGLVLGPLSDLGQVAILASKVGMSVTDMLSQELPASRFLKYVLTLEFLMTGVVLVLMARKISAFRAVASGWLVFSFPLACLIGYLNSFEGLGEILGQTFPVWIMSCGIWVTYLNLSKRVRVTFEHTISVSSKVAGSKDSAKWSSLSVERSVSTPSFREADEQHFATAGAEIGSASLDSGLWHRLLVENAGDEKATRLKYIETRAKRLKDLRIEANPPEVSRLAGPFMEFQPPRATLPDPVANSHLPKGFLIDQKEQAAIIQKSFFIVALAVALVAVFVTLENRDNTPVTTDAGTIPLTAEEDFMNRFPEWSTPERRLLLQARAENIHAERRSKGEAPLSVTAALEQARMQLVDEGHN